jgi:hypothetical protein
MAVTADFTNFYVGGTGAAQYNGGSSKGAPKYSPADCTVDAGSTTVITDNAVSNQWAGCAADDWLCWDTGGSKEFRRIVSINAANATVSAACTPWANKAVNVGGAWSLISHAAARVSVSFVNAAGLPPKAWLLAGTYAAETGSTGCVDFTVNNGTAALPLSFEGYTTAEGDGDDDCVVVDGIAGPALHGVYVNKNFLNFRFIKAQTDTAGKFPWWIAGVAVTIEDTSAYTTGGGSPTYYVSDNVEAVIRARVIGTPSVGIWVATGYSCVIEDCDIGFCGSYGIYAAGNAFLSGIRGCRIHDLVTGTSSHGIKFDSGYDVTPVSGCTFYNIHGNAINSPQPTYTRLVVTNCIFEDIDLAAIKLPGNAIVPVRYCAFYNVGTNGTEYFDATVINQNTLLDAASSHNVFQTAGSFFAETTNFTLNNTAGRGALCRGTGYPAYRDIGAMQSNPVAGLGPVIVDENDDTWSWGTLDNTGAYQPFGIVDADGLGWGEGGVLTAAGVAHAEGVLQNSGADYFTLASELSAPYLAGFEAGGGAGIDPEDIVSVDYIKDGVERYAGSGTYGSYPTTEDSFAEGQADQLATDILAVAAELGNMTTAVHNLLHADNDGTIDMSTYTLIGGVVAAGDVRKGIARYTSGGNGSLVGCVDANGVNQGATGVLEAGSVYSALNLWIEKADVVSEAWVATGHKNYVGGADGEYPTTLVTQTADKNAIEAAVLATNGWDSTIHLPNDIDATAGTALVYAAGQTNQLLTDIGEVTTHAGSIKDDDAILSVNGAYDFAGAIQAGYVAGALAGAGAQLIVDKGVLDDRAAHIVLNTDFGEDLGTHGALNMSLYTLISGVVAADWVVKEHDNYTGGGHGTYPTIAESFDAGAAAQHATDAAAVNAELANMTTAVVNLLDAANDGTLNMSLYTLLDNVKTTLNTNKDEMIAANTDIQAAYSCDAGTASSVGGGVGVRYGGALRGA